MKLGCVTQHQIVLKLKTICLTTIKAVLLSLNVHINRFKLKVIYIMKTILKLVLNIFLNIGVNCRKAIIYYFFQ